MYKKTKYSNGTSFFPNFLMQEAGIISIFLAIFFGIVFLFPEFIFSPDENLPANPLHTPEHIKPEWYFLASYQSLKLIPSELGALILQAISLTILIFLPLIDRSNERNIWKRPIFLFVILSSITLFIVLTIWGRIS